MGQRFLDKFSLLHFAWGIILYFFNVSLPISTLISILFELIENSDIGIKFIQTYIIGIWPGGKDRADSVYNQVGDVLSLMVGWILAYYGFKANTTQTTESAFGILLMVSLIPAAGSFIVAGIMSFYQLDNKTMDKIESDLKARREISKQ